MCLLQNRNHTRTLSPGSDSKPWTDRGRSSMEYISMKESTWPNCPMSLRPQLNTFPLQAQEQQLGYPMTVWTEYTRNHCCSNSRVYTSSMIKVCHRQKDWIDYQNKSPWTQGQRVAGPSNNLNNGLIAKYIQTNRNVGITNTTGTQPSKLADPKRQDLCSINISGEKSNHQSLKRSNQKIHKANRASTCLLLHRRSGSEYG